MTGVIKELENLLPYHGSKCVCLLCVWKPKIFSLVGERFKELKTNLKIKQVLDFSEKRGDKIIHFQYRKGWYECRRIGTVLGSQKLHKL